MVAPAQPAIVSRPRTGRMRQILLSNAAQRPNSLLAFSFRMSGRTSSRISMFLKSASHRSGVIAGQSEPNSILCFRSVLAYCTRIGEKYFGDQPDRSI